MHPQARKVLEELTGVRVQLQGNKSLHACCDVDACGTGGFPPALNHTAVKLTMGPKISSCPSTSATVPPETIGSQ
eukprot:1221895-Amphidinium_carterae.1